MKKLFRISALVAMVSMMATATVATSCSDDDDDDPSIVLSGDTSFTVKMGGEESSAASFLSVNDAKAYKQSVVSATPEYVEIVFDGTTFKSAKESVHSLVKTNGQSAKISQTSPLVFAYETSTGYKGTLTLTEAPGDASASYTVTVIRQKK